MIQLNNVSKIYKRRVQEKGFLNYCSSLFNKKYDKIVALEHISLTINQGELVALIGENGSGKTTLFKLLAGLIKQSSGDINVLGYTPSNLNKEFLSKIALVLAQKTQMWWDLSPNESFLLTKKFMILVT